MGSHPVAAISGVHYSPHPHGTQSRDEVLSGEQSLSLPHAIIKGKIPRKGKLSTFAIASPIDVWDGDTHDFTSRSLSRLKRMAKESGGLQALRQRRLLRPYAMVTADFDCVNTKENLLRIADALEHGQERERWILDSGHSFYLVEEKLVNYRYWPIYMGQLIMDLSSTAPIYRRHIIEAFGRDLITNYKNPDGLRSWANDVFGTFKHYDEPEKNGLTFMLDMRHAARSVMEYIRLLETGEGGFGYIRMLGKTPTDKPPRVVAVRWPYCRMQFRDLKRFDREQRQRYLF